MPKLNYDLDDIQEYAVEPGKYKARLQKVESALSKARKPMLIWHWKIMSGSEKGSEIRSWTSLQDNALGALKNHLEAFGLSGKVKTNTSRFIGKRVIIVVAVTSVEDDAGETREFSNVIAVKPGSKAARARLKANKALEEETDEEDYDEEEDDAVEDEDEDEDDDEDWEDDDEDEEDYEEDDEEEEEEEEAEEEPAPRKKKKRKAKKRKARKPPF